MQNPSVGRIVHYRRDEKVCAAIITYVWSTTTVSLAVFTPTGETLTPTSVTLGDGDRQWSWPPRV